ncbi:MAG: S8/S53 family peptidase [Kordia sp.]|uniref:S8/S53 family peptidase n=1 Tax=Kordia sp. TaxID=1965332 RepID=UPI00385AAA0F
MKRILVIFCFFIALQSCTNEEVNSLNEVPESNILTKSKINDLIIEKQGKFEWNDLNDEQLYSAFTYSENLVIISWNYDSENDLEKTKIIEFILDSEGKDKNKKDIILEIDDQLNFVFAKIYKKETLLGLRRMQEVAAVEPMYAIFTESEFRTKEHTYTKKDSKINPTVFTENSRIPVDTSCFYNHAIDVAWNYGLSGQGIEVAVIDNGVYENDPEFGEGINSSNRNVKKRSRYKTPWWKSWRSYKDPYPGTDGHGTTMTHLIGAPENGSKGTGVAYNTNLRTVRSTGGLLSIWIDIPDNMMGIARSFSYLSGKQNVKIISMSQGGLIRWTPVKRGIRRCLDNGKLIFCAAGTVSSISEINNFLGVQTITLFPANYSINNSKKVYAVTGVEKVTGSFNNADWCQNCHGIADFVVEFDTEGSSSNSTATTAGMAALIWAEHPNLSRSSIIGKMKQAADRTTDGTKHHLFGYGRVNMEQYLINEGRL